jgi:hypothetical protein
MRGIHQSLPKRAAQTSIHDESDINVARNVRHIVIDMPFLNARYVNAVGDQARRCVQLGCLPSVYTDKVAKYQSVVMNPEPEQCWAAG